MVLGDTKGWVDRFSSLEERLLERILLAWAHCKTVLSGQALEDTITIQLVAWLGRDTVTRQMCYMENQYPPFGIAPDGSFYSKGFIDMAAILDQDRETYLAYECKRLNVVYPTGRQSLATAYVQEGMMRFVTEQYAEGLPFGSMLGYVLDGDVPFARQQVNAAMAVHPPLNLTDGPIELPSLSGATRFRTSHIRNSGTAIELRHSFLS
jgi:hypothetical protein